MTFTLMTMMFNGRCFKMHVFEAHHKYEWRYRLHTRRKCRRMILVSKTIRFMRIFAGLPREGAPNDSMVVKNRDVQPFRWLNFIKQGFGPKMCSSMSPFQWSPNAWPWM